MASITTPTERAKADAECTQLLARRTPLGATIAEIRERTGWKGQIKDGPERCAKRARRKLCTDHAPGENQRFWFGRELQPWE
jgi:chorismate mutase